MPNGDPYQDSRQFLVREVIPGTPADGKLRQHDVILGVISPGGWKERMDAIPGSIAPNYFILRSLGIAIEEAEKPENGGKLKLKVWRPETEEAPVPKGASGGVGTPKSWSVRKEPLVAKTHEQGKIIRFWNAPNHPDIWTGQMVDHVRKVLESLGEYHPAYDPKAGYEIAGFAWFQGWNDMGDTDTYPPKLGAARYAPYSDALAHFIRDVRKDFKAPEMPFVIGVMGIGNDDFRAAMAVPAKMEEFKGNVIAVDTKEYLDEKLNELINRGRMWSERYDKDNKYAQLRQKLEPLQKELDETKKIENEKERKTKTEQIQQRMKDIIYTPEETEYMANNRSSQGFHYFGSPKFFARIGEAFANALIEVEKAKQSK